MMKRVDVERKTNKVLKSLTKSHTSLIKSKESLEKSLKMEREMVWAS